MKLIITTYQEFEYKYTPNIPRKIDTNLAINLDKLSVWQDYSICNVTQSSLLVNITYEKRTAKKNFNMICTYADVVSEYVDNIQIGQFMIDASATIIFQRSSANEIIIKT